MMRETTVFGPIFSRRLGSSLGINLLPQKGKICNFDCVYCECGWNKDGRGDTLLPTADDVRKALEEKLAACAAAGTPIALVMAGLMSLAFMAFKGMAQ